MSHRLFELFAKMVAKLPPRAITKALDLECEMIEHDAGRYRRTFPEDTRSILSFRQFIQKVKLGQPMERVNPFPPDHVEFFKETIVRLIQADELPASAMGQFDDTFVRPGFS
jgi:hypothetical protein